MSIFTGKDGYNSDRMWKERSARALNSDAELYDYDSRLLPDDPIYMWLKKKFIQQSTYPNVLEIGCGFGRWAKALHAVCASYVGVDVVPARVDYTTKRLQYLSDTEFRLVSGEWDLGRKFDVVLSITVLQHLLIPEAAVELRAIERHLAPGGEALLAEWRIDDITLAEAERRYAVPGCPAHMIPKPLGMLKSYAPTLDWFEDGPGYWILRRRK